MENQYLFQREVVLVLCINFFVNGTRKAVLIFKESMGLFWYDRYKAIAEAILNLGISILLVTHFGVVGVFAGTFCSTVLTSVWVEPYIIYRYRFQKPVREYFWKIQFVSYCYGSCLGDYRILLPDSQWKCSF